MLLQTVENTLQQALNAAIAAGELPAEAAVDSIKVEIPRDTTHGDYATNLAMALAKPARKAPRMVAETLIKHLDPALFEKVEIAGPGFINFRLAAPWLHQQIQTLRAADSDYGKHAPVDNHHYLLEFVSANPTGPLHFGHGRWAVLGDCLARLLRIGGYNVDTEFYVNDSGSQIRNLGESVRACYYQVAAEQGQTLTAEQAAHQQAYADEKANPGEKVRFYHGPYVYDLGQQLYHEQQVAALEHNTDFFSTYAKMAILAQQKQELEEFGVTFKTWFLESSLHTEQAVTQALEHMKALGKTYEQDGALWFRSTEYGDNNDKVLIKKDGSTTYFANDIAYHWNKLNRGYDRLINIWGADHHGYIPRMSAAVQALGHPPEALEVLLGQMVNLYRAGEKVRMSKRTGDMVTFAEVFEEVGKDATRYLLMQRSADSPVDFDLELAKTQSSENPVFYVQYAHARICSIFRTAANVTRYDTRPWQSADLSVLQAPEERSLMIKLLAYPDEVSYAAAVREPHRLTGYAQELASLFHQFYKQCRVLFERPADQEVPAEEVQLSLARLYLADAVRIVLRNLLTDIFGISAPESM